MASPYPRPSPAGAFQSTGYYNEVTPCNDLLPYPTSTWPGIHTAPRQTRQQPPKLFLPPITTNFPEKRLIAPFPQPVAGYEGLGYGKVDYSWNMSSADLHRSNATHGSV